MIADNNPERRNLTILSLAIIIFYVAGGAPVDHDITLSIIHLKFSHPEVLKYVVWIILLWFIYRYWITNKYTVGRQLEDDRCNVDMDYFYIKRYVNSYYKNYTIKIREKQAQDVISGLRNTQIFLHGDRWIINSNLIPLSGFVGYLIRAHYLIKILFRHRAASDYYAPYALFYSAVFLGLKHSSVHMNIWSITPVMLLLVVQYIYETR